MDGYKTIQGEARAELVEKKSRFIGRVCHVETEEEALAFLASVRAENPEARHNVYVYILRENNRVRYSDDGEPQKTAGLPALSVVQHAELTDIICVITRYFGGTLLGTGGLVRAYTQTTQQALAQAQVVQLAPCRDTLIDIDYALYDSVAHYLKEHGVKVLDTAFMDRVTLTVRTLSEDADKLEAELIDFTQGRAEILVGDEALQFVDSD